MFIHLILKDDKPHHGLWLVRTMSLCPQVVEQPTLSPDLLLWI